MPPIAHLGSLCTGHHCFHPRPSIQGSPDAYVNGIPIHRMGDAWAPHTCGDSVHAGNLAVGSSTVFVNGQPIGRVGDLITCGSYVVTGSPDSFAGG